MKSRTVHRLPGRTGTSAFSARVGVPCQFCTNSTKFWSQTSARLTFLWRAGIGVGTGTADMGHLMFCRHSRVAGIHMPIRQIKMDARVRGHDANWMVESRLFYRLCETPAPAAC